MEHNIDNRTHQRFQAKNQALALVFAKSSPHFHSIIDISHGGMALGYSEEGAVDTNGKTMAILFEDNVCLDRLPITVISDGIAVDTQGYGRRCCIQFNKLTPDQKQQLDHFISQYTVGSA